MFDRNKKPHNPDIVRGSLVQIRPVRHLLETHHAAAALPGVARASCLGTSVAAAASAAAVWLVPASFLSWLTDKAECGKDRLSQHQEQPRICVCLKVGRRAKIRCSGWRSRTESVRCPVRAKVQGCLPRKGLKPAVPLCTYLFI